MTDYSDESVIAYIDNRMDGSERAAFEVRLANDATLSDRVASHRWLTQQIVAAYPVPTAQCDGGDLAARFGLPERNVIPISRRRQLGIPWAGTWMAGAMAASLMIGLVVGQLGPPSAEPLIALRDGRPTASGALADNLSNRLSGETGAIRIALTFRTKNGVCRAFQAARAVAGVACRVGSHWDIPIMEASQSNPGDQTEYRLAGSNLSPSLMARVDQMILGEPVGPLDEAEFMRSDWR